MSKRKPRLCIIINPSIALTLLRKQWTFWIKHGFEVHCITGPGPKEHEKVRKMRVKTYVVPMERYPSFIKDLISLMRLWWVLLWNRFDIIHVSTPKFASHNLQNKNILMEAEYDRAKQQR